ncbi:MAG: hypothetical protein R3B72_43105 [Polyangiaceae bacterium]
MARTTHLLFAMGTLLTTFGVVTATGCPGPEPQLVSTGGGGGAGGTTGQGGVTSSGGAGGTGTGGTAGAGGQGGSAGCRCDAVDVLVVIDNTDAIDAFAVDLLSPGAQLAGQIASLAEDVCSFHIGTVTSRVQPNNPSGCDVFGALSRVGSTGEACPLGNGRFATEQDNLANAIPCLFQPGTQGNNNERPMEAMLAALSPEMNAPGACNEGFFRPDAPLLIVVVSSVEDDDSAGDPTSWFADLVTLNGGDSSSVASLGILGPIASEMGCDAEASPRLHSFFGKHDLNNQAVTEICHISVNDLLDGAVRMSDAVCPPD